jgi:multidrug resistance efflux pump
VKRHLFAVGWVVALAYSGAAQEPKVVQPPKDLGAAQDPKPAQPPKAGNPAAQRARAEATKRLAEEVESIEAHLQTKKAYVQAATVSLLAAERTFERVSKLVAAGNATRETADDAKIAMEAAKAQVMIREAEANEVAVKLKHAKRRVEESQKAELQDDLRLKLQLLEAEAGLRLAQAELKQAETELKRLEELAKRGIVAPAEFEAAQAKQVAAKAKVDYLTTLADMLKKSPKP